LKVVFTRAKTLGQYLSRAKFWVYSRVHN
jgi:hypothetical protein